MSSRKALHPPNNPAACTSGPKLLTIKLSNLDNASTSDLCSTPHIEATEKIFLVNITSKGFFSFLHQLRCS